MIFGTAGTLFLSTVCLCGVDYVRRRCQRQSWNWASWLIFGSEGPSFLQRFLSQSSLCTLKISASAVELGFEDDIWDSRDSFFINYFSLRSRLCA
jgi:hypothetical protein